MKTLTGTIAAIIALGVASASADYPNSTGVPEKGCKPVANGKIYVGASDMPYAKARYVARNGYKNRKLPQWDCTGKGSTFGHCHDKEDRRRKAHWADNH